MNQRKIALFTGFGLLVMAIVAAFANFGIMAKLVVANDATATMNNITNSQGLFTAGIVGFIVVILLDLLLAWLLYEFFKPDNKNLSAAAAWFRVFYAVIFTFGIIKLIAMLANLGTAKATSVSILQSINSFNHIWSFGYIFFGIHLALLGYLVVKSGYIAKWIGVLLSIAGLGYFIDAIGTLLISKYSLNIGMFTFIGEIIFMFWLLFKGGKNKQVGAKL